MAGTAQGQWEANQVIGHYKLLRPFSGEFGGPWQVYAARHVETGSPALLLRPKKGSVWAPQRNWQGRVIACTEPPHLVLDVDRLPDLHTLPAITDDLDDLTTTCEWLDFREDAAQHLRSRPRKRLAQAGEEGAPTQEAEEDPMDAASVSRAHQELMTLTASVMKDLESHRDVVGQVYRRLRDRRSPTSEEGAGQAPAQEIQVAAPAVERTMSEPGAVEQSSPRPERPATLRARRPYWFPLAVASLVALVLVPSTLHEQRTALEAGTGNAAMTGLAEQALAAPELPRASLDKDLTRHAVLALDMPTRAFPGQHLAPCGRLAREIVLRDGSHTCWIKIDATAEVCKTEGYEWKGGCYLPSIPSARTPSTALPPRTPPAPAIREQ